MAKSATPKYGKAPKPSYNKPAQPKQPGLQKTNIVKTTKVESR